MLHPARLLLFAAFGAWGCQGQQAGNEAATAGAPSIQEGDVVFQMSMSAQCEAIRAATGSPYAHCGIIHLVQGVPHVLEAVQPVRLIPLTEWSTHGRNGHYVVKRTVDPAALDAPKLQRMWEEGRALLSRNYDAWFMWSDDEIYCSELVWKVYERGAGITLSTPRPLAEFDLTAPVVRQVMQQRYGDKVPLKEPMVAPSDLFDSPLLKEVMRVGGLP